MRAYQVNVIEKKEFNRNKMKATGKKNIGRKG